MGYRSSFFKHKSNHPITERIASWSKDRPRGNTDNERERAKMMPNRFQFISSNCYKFTSCQQVVFALLVPSCCNKFGTSCWQLVASMMALSNLLQGCSNKSDTVMNHSWYNKNATRLMTQGCNNIVISWLYQTCWNNFATSLIISTRLLQVVNSLWTSNIIFNNYWIMQHDQ
jgi:hypothetical protein